MFLMSFTNASVAKLLREVAAAYQIKKIGNIFQIRAYEGAADSIEHSTSDIKDLWEEGKLTQVPGLGKTIISYLDELFSKGAVKHFEEVKSRLSPLFFELLDIPGVGPKTAFKITEYKIHSLKELQDQIKSGELVSKGFSAKISENIMEGIMEAKSLSSNRMLLPYASAQAEKILEYLKGSKDIIEAYPLGSLRRQVATIGDLDFSISSNNPQKAIDYFCQMPNVKRVVDRGEYKAVVILNNGLHVDLLVGKPEYFGALLQHFTGSKFHNIHLRTLAEKNGLSLSEYGVKEVKTGKVVPTKTEQEFYSLLKMDVPEPEIREDGGEIEAALLHKLPSLIEVGDIKGDLHIHTNFPLERPSHGPGADTIETMVKKAKDLGYLYIGISDHPPGFSAVSKEEMRRLIEKRTKYIQNLNKSTNSIRVLNGLEIDILGDGSLGVPDEVLATLDYAIAGIHSGHRGSREQITKRLLKALENPYIDGITHPSNRLINERDSSEADWTEIYKFCAKNKKLLEINGFPNRLDLRDDLVKEALSFGVKFIINTDAHGVDHMQNMPYGVAVARRGWVTKKDVVNVWGWTDFAKWFNI